MLRGHEVDVANDAFAIDRMDSSHRPYDLILCNLASHERPGPELRA